MSKVTVESLQAFTFPRPPSPEKDSLKPNPHPYPIRTTSTALLTRSNSSPRHQAHHSGHSHHYVPTQSPSPTQHRKNSHSGSSGHRYSRSLSSDDNPRPLPTPPGKEAGEVPPMTPLPRRSKRADTLPPPPSPSEKAPHFALEDLPPNPKSWTPSQLSAYLSSALRVKSGEALELPAPIARDIAAFVRESRISGRAFLRFNDADLERYGINKQWRTTLLSASRNLRQNVLKGQIWGIEAADESAQPPDTPPSADEEEDDGTPNNHRRRRSISHSYTTNPFVNGTAFYSSASSSSSMEDVSQSAETSPVRNRFGGRYRNGRVKGMVQSFERSSSFDDGQPDFIGEQRTGRSHQLGNSSDSGLEESGDDVANMTLQARRPLPTPPIVSSPFSDIFDGPEPTMEELLASTPSEYPLLAPTKSSAIKGHSGRKKRGAHAWEAADDGGLVTVKRAANASQDAETTHKSLPRTSSRGVGNIFSTADIGVSVESPLPSTLGVGVETDPVDDVENTLRDAVESTRSLLALFQQRLTDVEQKIQEMETRQHLREQEKKPAVLDKAVGEDESPPASVVAIPHPQPETLYSKLLSRIFGIPSPRSGDPKSRRQSLSAYDRILNPKFLTQLPPYVILVSIGVCAVVLKVVIRRTFGQGLVRRR